MVIKASDATHSGIPLRLQAKEQANDFKVFFPYLKVVVLTFYCVNYFVRRTKQ